VRNQEKIVQFCRCRPRLGYQWESLVEQNIWVNLTENRRTGNWAVISRSQSSIMLSSRRWKSTDENTVNSYITERTLRWSAEWTCRRVYVNYRYRKNKIHIKLKFAVLLCQLMLRSGKAVCCVQHGLLWVVSRHRRRRHRQCHAEAAGVRGLKQAWWRSPRCNLTFNDQRQGWKTRRALSLVVHYFSVWRWCIVGRSPWGKQVRCRWISVCRVLSEVFLSNVFAVRYCIYYDILSCLYFSAAD